jgi:sensor histidine kinase YesM
MASNDALLRTEGVGLSNVRARLHQIYGSDFRFELKNGTGGGLTVVMEIPLQREADFLNAAHTT